MCITYVLSSYAHRCDSDKTYASCWLARVAVGSLVLHEAGGYIPPPPRPQTGRFICENFSRRESRQPNKKSPSSQRNLSSWRRSQGSPGVENRRNGLWNATERTVFRKTLSPCNAKRERTVFRTFLDVTVFTCGCIYCTRTHSMIHVCAHV